MVISKWNPKNFVIAFYNVKARSEIIWPPTPGIKLPEHKDASHLSAKVQNIQNYTSIPP
jgi:hypothetical protein